MDMKVYKQLPKMLKWKKLFVYFSLALAFIFFVHSNTFLFIGSVICLLFSTFFFTSFILAEYITGDSQDLSFFTKMNWYEEKIAGYQLTSVVMCWCMENLEGKWRETDKGYFLIKNEIDAMAFKLRWS